MDAVEVVNSSEETKLEEDEVMPEEIDVCRVCLLGNSSLRGLFHDDNNIVFSQKIMALANVKIMPGDGLPSHICCDCCDKLEISYKFKLQVEQADAVLRGKVDSLHMKDEYFFDQVNVNLSHHGNNVSDHSQDSLILKEHMDLLSEKIDEEVLQTEHREKKEDDTIMDEQVVEMSDSKEKSQEFPQKDDEIAIKTHQELDVEHEEQMQEETNEPNNQFETEELQDLMLNEIRDREELQNDLNHVHQMALDEHDYVADSQHCKNISENDVSLTQETKQYAGEIKEEDDSLSEKPKAFHVSNEAQPNEATRRSQRKINQRKAQENDELNYFENLNLSSRLKQTDKSEKVYFMCFICDKQFLSKEVLREHMQTHEELRKSFPTPVKRTPEKAPIVSTSQSPSKPSTSGKQPNTCPHCGKVYLYVISFKKHLQQHEKDKGEVKDEMMPLEVSFREDDDTLDYQGYDENPMDYNIKIKTEGEELQINNVLDTYRVFKCTVCSETFATVGELKNHRMKHAIEGVLSDQDLDNVVENNIPDFIVDNTKEEIVDNKQDIKDSKTQIRKSIPSLTKYDCKVCHESFTRKDLLRKHAEMHATNLNGLKSFKCTQCHKTFNNELTLRNHLITTNHKTIMQGQEYDPNKRIKRSAAKAAQKIIDQIKILDESEDELDKEKEKNRNFEDSVDISPVVKDFQLNVLHVTKKQSPKIYSCAACNLKLPSKQALAKHMELHSKDENSSKSESTKKEEMQLKKEFDDDDEDDDDFEGGLDWPMDSHECPTCKKKYSTKKSLLRHQLLHEEPNFECDICNVKFYRKDKLKAHYDKCSEKNPDQVRKCNICGDTFENNDILKEHRTKHVIEGILTEEDLQEIEPKPDENDYEKAPRKRRTDIVGLECQECNKRYTSRKGLLRHIQVHEGKKYLCDICPKKFYRREHLKLHVAKHNMIKPYKCLKCPKRFIKEEQMKNHMQKHERVTKKPKESDTPKRFLCEICSKSFTQSTTLIAHLRAHKGIKPYVCEVCSRPFTTNAYLKMHMRTHTQERPYICQYCSRAFARADTLANHLTSHTGEAKYSCKYCPKHFRRLKSLKEHVFIHTGQRPYACPTCDRRFNNNGSRYAHSKRCKQNVVQGRQNNQISVQDIRAQEQEEQEAEDHPLQLEVTQDLRLQPATISQAQIIKPQNIKTITFARPGATIEQSHVLTNQDVYMPLIFVNSEELIALSEGNKIFTS